jgi:hypothetical protein
MLGREMATWQQHENKPKLAIFSGERLMKRRLKKSFN